MAAIPDPRRPSPNSSVRRVLFPPTLEDQFRNDNLSNTLKEELVTDRKKASEKWNFDFERSVPLPGRFEWTRFDEACKYVVESKSNLIKSPSVEELGAVKVLAAEPINLQFVPPSDSFLVGPQDNEQITGVSQYTNPQKQQNEMTPVLKLKRKRNSKQSPASLKRIKRDLKKSGRTFKVKRSLLF